MFNVVLDIVANLFIFIGLVVIMFLSMFTLAHYFVKILVQSTLGRVYSKSLLDDLKDFITAK